MKTCLAELMLTTDSLARLLSLSSWPPVPSTPASALISPCGKGCLLFFCSVFLCAFSSILSRCSRGIGSSKSGGGVGDQASFSFSSGSQIFVSPVSATSRLYFLREKGPQRPHGPFSLAIVTVPVCRISPPPLQHCAFGTPVRQEAGRTGDSALSSVLRQRI